MARREYRSSGGSWVQKRRQPLLLAEEVSVSYDFDRDPAIRLQATN